MSKGKQTLLKGAIILVAANLLVKVISALFKLPIITLIGSDGYGLFNNAYSIYSMLFVVATAGFPVAVSKMVSEAMVLGKLHEADRIFKTALVFMLGIGVISSLILYFGAEQLALFINRGSSRASLSIMAISPAIVCIALVCAFRGYFQGRQNMYPTAVSEVVEAVGKLVVGYFLAYYFIQSGGEKVIEKASAGAIFGVSAGAFLALVSIVLMYLYDSKSHKRTDRHLTRPIGVIFKQLIAIALPITIGSCAATMTNFIDGVTILNRLQTITAPTAEFISHYGIFIKDATAGIDGILANEVYGAYSAFAATMFNLPQVVIIALAMSIVPAVSRLIAEGNRIGVHNTIKSILRITMMFAVPCAVGLSVLSEPILRLVFSAKAHEAVLAVPQLQNLSIAIIWVSLVSITTAVIQSSGKVYIPVINMFIGGIIKVIINYTLVAIPSININGAPIGTNVCYFVIMLLNTYQMSRVTGLSLDVIGIYVKPAICGVLMGVGVYSLYELMSYAGISYKIAVLAAIAAGALIYGILTFLTKTITEEDVSMLPGSEKLIKLLRKVKLL